jgi:uncharacterized iron-regulated membrane protein
MAWLHTWTGLLVGWALFVIFATGTAAYFNEEITRWMQPEVSAPASPARAAQQAADYLGEKVPTSPTWFITVPNNRSAATQLFWAPPEGAPRGKRGERSANLDGEGQRIEARDTRGGFFLYRFHFDLHYMPVMIARYIVGVCAMFMLVAIVSGIVTHKKIFTDFFTLRFGKGQRSWLDAHNVSAVLTLPFVLMITYTGLVTLASQYMPFGIAARYADERAYFSDLSPAEDPPEKAGRPAPLAPLGPMVQQAEAAWGPHSVGQVNVKNPGDANARVTVFRATGAALYNEGARMVFDGASGQLLQGPQAPGAGLATQGVMIGLHAGRFAHAVLRWLYFGSGLAGTVMVATGLILWTVKRRQKLPDPARPHFGFRLVERLNVATIAGFTAGLAGYFLSNRLLPLQMAERSSWEINSLFITWGAVAVWVLARPLKRAWVEGLTIAAALYAAAPIVSWATTPRNVLESVWRGDWGYAGFELTVFSVAAGLGFAAWKIARHQPKAARVRRPEALAA